MAKQQWDNEDIASNCAAEVCRVACAMKGIDPNSHEPGLHQLSRDVYELVYNAMEGRDGLVEGDPEMN